ncbi:GreA/GreB family elongation factor [Burkholderia stagnalis]
MAKACLGKSLGDEINVFTPSGKKNWYILSITYK